MVGIQVALYSDISKFLALMANNFSVAYLAVKILTSFDALIHQWSFLYKGITVMSLEWLISTQKNFLSGQNFTQQTVSHL